VDDVIRGNFVITDLSNKSYKPSGISLDGGQTFLPFLIQGETFPAVQVMAGHA